MRILKLTVEKIEAHISSPYTNTYGLARSLLAFGTLFTLLFNNDFILFTEIGTKLDYNSFFHSLNIFNVFASHPYIARWIIYFICIWVISGYLPQVSSILHWWISLSFICSVTLIDGGDQITAIITFLLIPVAILDNRINHWSNKIQANTYKKFLGTIFIYLIKIQVFVLYFNSAIAKFNVPEWFDGTAMYYWFTNNTFGSPSYLNGINWLTLNKYFVALLTWGVILFEILLSFAVFLKPQIKILIMCFGIIFHFLIFLILGLGSFFFAMVAALLLYLTPLSYNLNSIKIIIQQYVYRRAKV